MTCCLKACLEGGQGDAPCRIVAFLSCSAQSAPSWPRRFPAAASSLAELRLARCMEHASQGYFPMPQPAARSSTRHFAAPATAMHSWQDGSSIVLRGGPEGGLRWRSRDDGKQAQLCREAVVLFALRMKGSCGKMSGLLLLDL